MVSAAVKACCRAGRPSEAEAILAKSLAEGLVPEVKCFLLCFCLSPNDNLTVSLSSIKNE